MQPELIKGYSQDAEVIETARGEYDTVYIDGSHEYEDALLDLKNYAPMVKQGGYLVIDDACTDMHMPWGYFQGIAEVTKATLEYIKEDEWEFITNVVHLRVYKKK
jgi:cephalosporin hydroxylase